MNGKKIKLKVDLKCQGLGLNSYLSNIKIYPTSKIQGGSNGGLCGRVSTSKEKTCSLYTYKNGLIFCTNKPHNLANYWKYTFLNIVFSFILSVIFPSLNYYFSLGFIL